MKLVTYNIQYSMGKDGRYDLGRISRALDGAALAGRVRSAPVDRDAAGSDHQPLGVDMDP